MKYLPFVLSFINTVKINQIIFSCAIFFTLAPYSASACQVGDKFVTSTSSEFTCVSHPAFGTGWKAPNGAIWSASSSAVYHNCDGQIRTGGDGSIWDCSERSHSLPYFNPITSEVLISPAIDACENLGYGSKLPSANDYYELIRAFDHFEGNNIGMTFLTKKGYFDQFNYLFPRLGNGGLHYFWTRSTTNEYYSGLVMSQDEWIGNSVWTVSQSLGTGYFGGASPEIPFAVRCIVYP